MKTGVIIQARTGSTRLPNKVLKFLPFNSEITALEQVIRRVKKSLKTDVIIIATTEREEDKPIIDIAKKENVNYFRGPERDVLSRYYLAAKENDLDTVVRITSDCPCIDPGLLDELIEEIAGSDYDYVTNTLERTYPHGLDVEVFTFASLEKAYMNADTEYEREHVTPHIGEHGERFRLKNIAAPEGLIGAEIRITLDTYDDYMLLCAVYDYLYNEDKMFTAYDVVELFRTKPWLYNINNSSKQKRKFGTLEEEINAAANLLGLQEMENAKRILEKHLA